MVAQVRMQASECCRIQSVPDLRTSAWSARDESALDILQPKGYVSGHTWKWLIEAKWPPAPEGKAEFSRRQATYRARRVAEQSGPETGPELIRSGDVRVPSHWTPAGPIHGCSATSKAAGSKDSCRRRKSVARADDSSSANEGRLTQRLSQAHFWWTGLWRTSIKAF
jgi:hypothetical protein